MYKLFIVLILLLSTKILVAEVANLYQSSVPVISQSKEERQHLLPQVLRRVILKIVGDRSRLDLAKLNPVLGQANKLVQQFRYEYMDELNIGRTQTDRSVLVLKFSEVGLDRLLTNAGLPTWSGSRPKVLVWLALDDGYSRTIVDKKSSTYNIPALLMRAADLRGLPIFMPMMDLQDHEKVTFADIWGNSLDNIELASERYAPHVITIARISMQDHASTHIYWYAVINGQSENWQSRGELPTALAAGIEELTDRLARRFTQVINGNRYEQRLALQIGNISSYADFLRLMEYLSHIKYISNMRLSSLKVDTINVTLLLEGDRSIFNQILTIGQVLMKDTTYSSPGILYYRLLP